MAVVTCTFTLDGNLKKGFLTWVDNYEAARDEYIAFAEQPNPGGDDFVSYNMRCNELHQLMQDAKDKVMSYAVVIADIISVTESGGV